MSYDPNAFGQTVRGMLHKFKMIQAIASNIANASTAGYKREMPESISFQSVLNEAALRDNAPGQFQKTGNPFDLAIEGNAYFLIESKNGPVPTRNGRLNLNEKGKFVNQEGQELVIVEKTDKPISLALVTEKDIKVNQNGEIFVKGERYGRIAMQVLDNKPVKVHQGLVEGSNVNLMSEMIALSMAFRSFEASEKTLGMEASVDKDLIEKYGRNV